MNGVRDTRPSNGAMRTQGLFAETKKPAAMNIDRRNCWTEVLHGIDQFLDQPKMKVHDPDEI